MNMSYSILLKLLFWNHPQENKLIQSPTYWYYVLDTFFMNFNI